jgi:hypothetical protein
VHHRAAPHPEEPPKPGAKTREMRFLAPVPLAERIRVAAEKDGRTVSNWLARAAEKQLDRSADK